MRVLMILTSLCSYFINYWVTRSVYGNRTEFNFEQPLTSLVWLTSAISIMVTFVASHTLLTHLADPRYLVVDPVHHHQLRDRRRCPDPGIHQGLYQHPLPSCP